MVDVSIAILVFWGVINIKPHILSFQNSSIIPGAIIFVSNPRSTQAVHGGKFMVGKP